MLEHARAGAPLPVVRLSGLGCAVLRVRNGDLETLRRIGQALGVKLPAEPNCAEGISPCALCLAPGEWLIVGEGPMDALEHVLASVSGESTCHVVDVSNGNAIFGLEGPLAARILSRGCSLDLHPRVFPPGCCAQTVFAHIPALIHRPSDGAEFRLYVDASYEAYFSAWLAGVVSLLSA
jgi:sarcosine oxidase subunit gamma